MQRRLWRSLKPLTNWIRRSARRSKAFRRPMVRAAETGPGRQLRIEHSSWRVGARRQPILDRFAVARCRDYGKGIVRRLARQIGKDELSSPLGELNRQSAG